MDKEEVWPESPAATIREYLERKGRLAKRPPKDNVN